uniref:Nucleoprotein n=1 Tax=Kilimanjaro virus TaxID=1201042 RepID=L7P8C5_9VIRU|nr:nucleocapsid [Kilimanjaro virus]
MEDVKKLEEEYINLERELTNAQVKLDAEIQKAGDNPDQIAANAIKHRQGVVEAYKQKLQDLRSEITKIQNEPKKEKPKEIPGVEEGDHLNAKSSLRYGNVIDLNPLDVDEPSGQTADWLSILGYISTLSVVLLLKGLYMLTTRGRQTTKDNKGTRIKFKDDSCMEDRKGIKQHRLLYISMPTSQSSIQDDELTPGRFRTIISGILPNEIRRRNLMSPVMGVIGFLHLAKDWLPFITEVLDAQCDFLEQDKANPKNSTNRVYFKHRQLQLDSLNLPEIRAVRDAVKDSYKVPTHIESDEIPWLFANAPDRCPPTVLGVAGVAELGAFFALMQDIRSAILASKMSGTAEEKMAKKSTFYQSYLRRTQSMGITCDQKIIHIYMDYMGTYCVDHFNLGDDMEPELRKKAQALLDRKVKEISSQEPV